MPKFEVVAPFEPAGDQPRAIAKLTEQVNAGAPTSVLLGVTGSGKTMTLAHVIANVGKPTLVLSHNKTLAAQLANEFKELLPNNAVEYFVSYYDYYQPEAYVPQTDTYIEKDSSINNDVERLRHSATMSLLSRRESSACVAPCRMRSISSLIIESFSMNVSDATTYASGW